MFASNTHVLFRAYRPGPSLSDFIDNLWLYDGYSSPHMHERIFPSGTFELVFNLRDDELRIYSASGSGRCSRYPGALVSGPYNAFFVTDRAEEFSVMGVHFRPGGAFPFLGVSADQLADTHLDLATIWGREAEEIRERLASTASGNPVELFQPASQSQAEHGASRRALAKITVPELGSQALRPEHGPSISGDPFKRNVPRRYRWRIRCGR